MSNKKEEFFNSIISWFLLNKSQAESQWSELIEKYGSEKYFGPLLRNAGHSSKVNSGEVHETLNFPLYWDYENNEGFYFNALSADLKKGQYEELKDKFTSLLGEPDEVFTYFGLNEPKWNYKNNYLSLYHVDTHGGGYEKIGLKVNFEN